MAKITSLSLFIINRVKFLRLIHGIPASRLSVFLKHTPAYIFNVENIELPTQYPPHELPKLAEGLYCDVHSLLPPNETEQISTGKAVEKIVLSLDNETDLKSVVTGLAEYGYFNQGRTLAETAKHLYIDNPKQLALLEKVITMLTKERVLKLQGTLFEIAGSELPIKRAIQNG